jgi:SIR2-like protein
LGKDAAVVSKPPALREVPDLPDEIVHAGPSGDLILFVGAGMSMLLDLPSWSGLARKTLEYLQHRGWLDFSEIEQLEALSPRTQLSIAKLIAGENGEALDLGKYFKGPVEGTSIYKTLNDIGCACVTTNYDELLAPRFLETKDGSTTAKPIVRIFDREQFFPRHLDNPSAVVHLHGCISDPAGMVVTTKEYLEHYDHRNLQHFLGDLFARKTVLFLGYGLEENELLEHILRRGSVEATGDRRRFALQGFFRSQQPLYEKLYQYYRVSFGVHLIGFIRDHKNYKQQDAILNTWASQIKISGPALTDDLALMNAVLQRG